MEMKNFFNVDYLPTTTVGNHLTSINHTMVLMSAVINCCDSNAGCDGKDFRKKKINPTGFAKDG